MLWPAADTYTNTGHNLPVVQKRNLAPASSKEPVILHVTRQVSSQKHSNASDWDIPSLWLSLYDAFTYTWSKHNSENPWELPTCDMTTPSTIKVLYRATLCMHPHFVKFQKDVLNMSSRRRPKTRNVHQLKTYSLPSDYTHLTALFRRRIQLQAINNFCEKHVFTFS